MNQITGSDDPRTWPADTIIVRGGVRDIERLRRRLEADGSWSVYSAPGASFRDLARSCRNRTVRRTTTRQLLAEGAALRPSSGPPYHCELSGLTPERFDAILGPEEPNPWPMKERWSP